MDHLLSSGSGRGRLAFFDMRANDYVTVQPEPLSCPQSPVVQRTGTNGHSLAFHDDETPDDDEYSDGSLNDTDMAAGIEARNHRDWFFQSNIGYDPPALSWRQQLPELPGAPARRSCFLQAGSGWLDHNHVYL